VWTWVLGGLAVAALVAAGVIVAARGDEDKSTLTDSERETTTTERPSTTTTSEGPSTTTTSTGGSGVSLFPDELRRSRGRLLPGRARIRQDRGLAAGHQDLTGTWSAEGPRFAQVTAVIPDAR
jgi:hypothetical protein